MNESPLFNILNKVDSTNNYAMAKVHEGLAKHGMAWFAAEQTAGKGQRGKQWFSDPGSSVILSISLQPSTVFITNPFYLSALVAVTCGEFLEKLTGNKFYLKWPNDLYWRDRKTGGILIENKYSGAAWNWAIIGIGINVNQTRFARDLPSAVSLRQVTMGPAMESVQLARDLHSCIMEKIKLAGKPGYGERLVQDYNAALYKKNEIVKLKKGNAVFSTTIKEVNKFGQLITEDNMQRIFNFGEVEWLQPPY
jgi:BirA family biotin operon repressor/biotin-[acetyl-CoA-carboxylase] ligase